MFESPCKPKWIERKNTRLKQLSEQFWVAEKPPKKPTKRGGGRQLKKVLFASSYGHFTAAKEFWSQCHI
jgi:hypothetical protein